MSTKRERRFVVVSPRAVSPRDTMPRIHPPLGAISVLAEARCEGYDVSLFDAAAEGLLRSFNDRSYDPISFEEKDGVIYRKTGTQHHEVAQALHAIRPDVIGFTCTTIVDRAELGSLTAILREYFPETPFILGGHEATQWAGEILGNSPYPIEWMPAIDYVVCGPGQPVIRPLLRHIENPYRFDLPSSVASRHRLIAQGFSLKGYDPNSYELPDYSLLPAVHLPDRDKPMDIYSFFGNPHAGAVCDLLGSEDTVSYMPLLTSHGCGYSCSFCDADPHLVRYSHNNVMKLVGQFDSLFGIDYIDLMDNNFGGGVEASRQQALSILESFARQERRIGFSNGLTFESMMRNDFRLLRAFKEYGNVIHIAFPCENGNERVLRMIRKPHTLSMITNVFEFAHHALLNTNKEGFFIGGFPETNGQPAETPDEVVATLRFAENSLQSKYLDQAIFLTLSPVTREYRIAWRAMHPTTQFEHCLFSKGAGIWPYPHEILVAARTRMHELNERLGRKVTREL